MQSIDDFMLNCTIDFNGAGSIDVLIERLNSLRKTLQTLGYSEADITKALKKGIANYTMDAASQLKILEAYNKDYSKKQETERKNQEEKERQAQYRRYLQQQAQAKKIAGIANPFAFISAKSGIHIQQLLNNVGRISPRVQRLGLVFQTFKGVWDFAESIAELNTKLLQLGYTSGLGAQKIADLGAAVTAFGGSAESIASGNEKFVMQIERMKRGGGLGYLGDVAYKYGFSVDLNADWEKNNKAAIDKAREMIASGDKTGAMAFLKEWDSANYTSNMMKASMSKEEVAANDAYFKSYDKLGDVDQVTEETQKFNMETAKAQRAWTGITNQLASMMLPLMTRLTSFVSKIADLLAKSPKTLKLVLTVLGAIMGMIVGMIVKQTILTTMHIASAIAKGNWGAAAAAGALIGVGIAGGMALASNTGDGNNKELITNTHSEKEVSIKDLIAPNTSGENGTGGQILTARQKVLLEHQSMLAIDSEWDPHDIYITQEKHIVDNLVEAFAGASEAAVKLAGSMNKASTEAMSVVEAQKLANSLSNTSNISHVANSQSQTSNVNVNISQNFNEADTSEIRAGTYDASSQVAQIITQAAKRFNT